MTRAFKLLFLRGCSAKYRLPVSARLPDQPTWAAKGDSSTNLTSLKMMVCNYQVLVDMGSLRIWQKPPPSLYLASLSEILPTGYTWPIFRQSQWYCVHIFGSSFRAAFLLTKCAPSPVGLASQPRDYVLIGSRR